MCLTGGEVATANAIDQSLPQLYGQFPSEETARPVYLILRVHQRQVVGAFYQRSSSFDCFYGRISPTRLDLTVVDSFSQTAHPFAVAMSPTNTEVAQASGIPVTTQPEGFHAVNQVGDSDLQILNACLREHPFVENH